MQVCSWKSVGHIQKHYAYGCDLALAWPLGSSPPSPAGDPALLDLSDNSHNRSGASKKSKSSNRHAEKASLYAARLAVGFSQSGRERSYCAGRGVGSRKSRDGLSQLGPASISR